MYWHEGHKILLNQHARKLIDICMNFNIYQDCSIASFLYHHCMDSWQALINSRSGWSLTLYGKNIE